jgi:undecaprenyl pyrophosphate phosphatase UppP
VSSFIVNLFNELGQWCRPYQYQVALAIIATLLVVFGNDINGSIKKMLSKQHFIVRIVIFILICTFGYGLLTVWLTNLLAAQLASIPTVYLAPTISGTFILLALYAQKQRHI